MNRTAVIFVHGLAKKPAPTKLEEIWRWGLSRPDPKGDVFPNPNPGIDLDVEGIPALFNYYADVFYGDQYETELGSYFEFSESTNEGVLESELAGVAGELQNAEPATPRELQFLARVEQEMLAQAGLSPASLEGAQLAHVAKDRKHPPGPSNLEIASWLPGPVKQALIKMAAMEAYYFLFNKTYTRHDGVSFNVRDELRQRLLQQLNDAAKHAQNTVLVTHSMGTMVAYDVLRNCSDCPPVSTLFTLGSPLGIQEVQDELRAPGTGKVDFPEAKLSRWINVYDPLDPVCGVDPRFANDYVSSNGKTVEDVKESNWGAWRHTSTHYLAGKRFRSLMADALQVTLR